MPQTSTALQDQLDDLRAARELRDIPVTALRDQNKIHRAITIGADPKDVFSFWRDFQNLPHFMKDLTEVQVLSSKVSRWVVTLKSGVKVEWEAEITEESEGKIIAWSSVKDAPVTTSGRVWFETAPAGLGTIVRLTMDYKVPGGKFAEVAAFFTGESPDVLIATNLKRLKAYLETGEVPSTEGQPTG